MNTVTYTSRSSNVHETISASLTCTENKAYLYLESDLAAAQGYGYSTADGEGWFTGTDPSNGNSLTCTITH